MSYSFNVRAASKALAKVAVAAEFDKVVAIQPVHAQDRAQAIGNANAIIDLLVDDDTQDISVNCYGSVGWNWVEGADESSVPLTSVGVGASARLYLPRTGLNVTDRTECPDLRCNWSGPDTGKCREASR